VAAGRFVDRPREIDGAVVAIDEDEGAGAARGELAGDGLADAAGGPGDQGHLVEDQHGISSSVGGDSGPAPRGRPSLPGNGDEGHQDGGKAGDVNSYHFSIAAWKSRIWASEAWRIDSMHFCQNSTRWP